MKSRTKKGSRPNINKNEQWYTQFTFVFSPPFLRQFSSHRRSFPTPAASMSAASRYEFIIDSSFFLHRHQKSWRQTSRPPLPQSVKRLISRHFGTSFFRRRGGGEEAPWRPAANACTKLLLLLLSLFWWLYFSAWTVFLLLPQCVFFHSFAQTFHLCYLSIPATYENRIVDCMKRFGCARYAKVSG